MSREGSCFRGRLFNVSRSQIGLRQMTDGVDKDSGIIEREKYAVRWASGNAKIQLIQRKIECLGFAGQWMLLGRSVESSDYGLNVDQPSSRFGDRTILCPP